MTASLNGIWNYSLLLIVVTIFGCRPDDDPQFDNGIGQSIYDDWIMTELVRRTCEDAINNFRGPCNECPELLIDTDNSYQLISPEKELIKQGVMRVLDDDYVTFDPSIFDDPSISNARYSLFRGALKFDYTDTRTQCLVTESYQVSGRIISGN